MLLLTRDELSGTDFGQEEERVGYNTGGEYQVSSDNDDSDDDIMFRSVCRTVAVRS